MSAYSYPGAFSLAPLNRLAFGAKIEKGVFRTRICVGACGT